MEKLPPWGRNIGQVVGPTYGIYAPLVTNNATSIESTKRETFSYGSHPRQELDVYQPVSSAKSTHDSASTPLLVFMHGGGFANGDKINEAQPLFYKNLGHFFANKTGLETICINYRLLKHGGKFPSGAEDIEQALKWIADKYKDQQRDIYLLGNSAGGINVVHWLFEPTFQGFRRQIIAGVGTVRLSGAIVVGALFDFEASSQILRKSLAAYLGEDLDAAAPIASLKRCAATKELTTSTWPRLLIGDSEYDPEDILKSVPRFVQSLRATGKMEVGYWKINGHNHISPPLALGSDIAAEEEWGYKVASWVNQQ